MKLFFKYPGGICVETSRDLTHRWSDLRMISIRAPSITSPPTFPTSGNCLRCSTCLRRLRCFTYTSYLNVWAQIITSSQNVPYARIQRDIETNQTSTTLSVNFSSFHSIHWNPKKTLKFGDKENLNLDEGDRIKLAWRSRHFENCKYFLDCHYWDRLDMLV